MFSNYSPGNLATWSLMRSNRIEFHEAYSRIIWLSRYLTLLILIRCNVFKSAQMLTYHPFFLLYRNASKTIARSNRSQLSKAYDLFDAEFDITKDKRAQRHYGAMASTHVLCVCPLMVLKWVVVRKQPFSIFISTSKSLAQT